MFARQFDLAPVRSRKPFIAVAGVLRARLASDLMIANGLEAVYLENRDKLLRFLRARGAGDAAEDVLQEVWLKVARSTAPVSSPLAYLYRVADTLMIDRHRARRQAETRDRDWAEAEGRSAIDRSETPDGERVLAARDEAARVDEALMTLGERAGRVFRRHRVDGLPQKDVAAEFGVSLSTVESDLRQAYRVLIDLRRRLDEA